MTLLDEAPVAVDAPTNRPGPAAPEPSAWRLALRLARRETRRRPGRTVLASLLIAVPVMAMTIGSVFARSETGDWPAQFERRFGDADVAVDPSNFGFSTEDPGGVVLPSGTTATDYLWVNTTVTTANAAQPFAYVTLTDLDLAGNRVGQPIEVIEGRVPKTGEMLIPRDLADGLDVSVGDDVTFERPAGTWTVSGISRMRDSYYTDVVVIPGFDRSRIAENYGQMVTLYDVPADVSPAEIRQLAAQLGGVTRLDDPFGSVSDTRGMAWGLVAGVLALVAVGIIVAAAFATSARRQLVMIGQLSSNGATESVVRRTLALQGTWTGLVGALVGIGVGVASLPLVKPLIERYILMHDVAPFRFVVADLVVIALTATVAGTVAAAVPARSASRIPVMSALAGRRPLGTLPKWLVPTGLLLLAGGLCLVAIASLGINGSSSGRTDDVWALLVLLGVVGVVFGMCCATPLVIERVGRIGRPSSLSWRLALRSLARSRTRSSAVVAAIAVAVGGSVAGGAIVEASIRAHMSTTPIVPADTIVFDAFQYQEGNYLPADQGPVIDLGPLPSAPLPGDLRAAVLEIVPGATIVPVRSATVDPAPYDTRVGDSVWPNPRGPRIADRALLDIIGLSSPDLDALESTGSLQPVGQWQLDHADEVGMPVYEYAGPDGTIMLQPTQGTTAYRYEIGGWGDPLVTEAYARSLGFDIVERGAIVRAPQGLTVAQRDRLAELQVTVSGPPLDAFVEAGDPPRSAAVDPVGGPEQWSITYDEPRYRDVDGRALWIARTVVLGAAVLFSLLVVAIGLSLAAAEGRDERNVLMVVGATPASMRRQAAARASVMAVSGITLGIPTGFLPAWVLYSVLSARSIGSEPLRFPWLIVAGLLVVVPVVVAGVAWIGSGVGQRLRPPSPARLD